MMTNQEQSSGQRKVAQARKEEIDHFKTRGVYEKVDMQRCWDETGKNPLAVRWVDIHQGDDPKPNYRTRLVAKEYRDDVKPELYSTPTVRELTSTPKQFARVYVKLPAEDNEIG